MWYKSGHQAIAPGTYGAVGWTGSWRRDACSLSSFAVALPRWGVLRVGPCMASILSLLVGGDLLFCFLWSVKDIHTSLLGGCRERRVGGRKVREGGGFLFGRCKERREGGEKEEGRGTSVTVDWRECWVSNKWPLLLQVSDVLRRRPLREVVLQTLPHIARSSFFLAVNGGGFVTFICLVRSVGATSIRLSDEWDLGRVGEGEGKGGYIGVERKDWVYRWRGRGRVHRWRRRWPNKVDDWWLEELIVNCWWVHLIFLKLAVFCFGIFSFPFALTISLQCWETVRRTYGLR